MGDRILSARDYITLLAATVALVAALFLPITKIVLMPFKLDGASVRGYSLNGDVINIGLDDERFEDRLSEVNDREYILRAVLTNGGYSVASIASTFVCRKSEDSPGPNLYMFNTYDPEKQIKIFPEILSDETIAIFGNFDSNPQDDLMEMPASTCSISYFDKYGGHELLFPVDGAFLVNFLS